jgi:hypothetical protein
MAGGIEVLIHPETKAVLDVYAVVRSLGMASGCLSCNGLIDPVRLAEASVGDPQQVRNQRYVDDPDVHAPSVVTLGRTTSCSHDRARPSRRRIPSAAHHAGHERRSPRRCPAASDQPHVLRLRV